MPRLLAQLLAAPILMVGLAACGGTTHKQTTSSTGAQAGTTQTTPPTPSSAGCQQVSQPAPRPDPRLARPTLRLEPATVYQAQIDTSCGAFTIALDVKRAPRTTASFVSLARQRFYDGLTFHRIVAGFVIQGGDPRGDGTGGPGYKTVEGPPSTVKYTRGVVAMAKGQAEASGTAGSQFFVVTGEAPPLDPVYALVGTVTQGQDVVDRIGVLQSDPQTGRPVAPVVIRQVRVVMVKRARGAHK